MKKFRVIVTKQAQADLRDKLLYIQNRLKNHQAVQSVYDDYKLTRKTLGEAAEAIHKSDSTELQKRDLKRINFRMHNYFMLFRIRDDRVEITNIFHGSEDFENKLR